jgi:hypothetical protein
VSPRTASNVIALRTRLDEAPTGGLYEDTGEVTELAPPTSEEARDAWATVGMRFGPGLARIYRLRQLLERGGLVDGFIAEHGVLGRKVLIKALDADAGPEAVRAFLAEATALWTLSHPSFPAVLEYGSDQGGRAFVILEYASGPTLASRLAEGGLDHAVALDVAAQVSEALIAAHARGVAHGALTAESIHLCDDPAAPGGMRVKIGDLAVGTAIGGDASHDTTADTGEDEGRTIRPGGPEADVAAAGALFAALARAVPTGAIADDLAEVAAAMRGRLAPPLVAVRTELGRLRREASYVQPAVAPPVAPAPPARWYGPAWLGSPWACVAVGAGGVGLAALLGALL